MCERIRMTLLERRSYCESERFLDGCGMLLCVMVEGDLGGGRGHGEAKGGGERGRERERKREGRLERRKRREEKKRERRREEEEEEKRREGRGWVVAGRNRSNRGGRGAEGTPGREKAAGGGGYITLKRGSERAEKYY